MKLEDREDLKTEEFHRPSFAATMHVGCQYFATDPISMSYLQRFGVSHIDVRVEWFPSPEEVLSASVFTKAFTDPVETIVIASAQQDCQPVAQAANMSVVRVAEPA